MGHRVLLLSQMTIDNGRRGDRPKSLVRPGFVLRFRRAKSDILLRQPSIQSQRSRTKGFRSILQKYVKKRRDECSSCGREVELEITACSAGHIALGQRAKERSLTKEDMERIDTRRTKTVSPRLTPVPKFTNRSSQCLSRYFACTSPVSAVP